MNTQSLSLDTLLGRNKTAAAAPTQQAPTQPASTTSKVAAAVDAATAAATAKVASTATPVMPLINKLASDLAKSDAADLEKVAARCGLIMADTFVAQMGHYEKIAAEVMAKTAAEQPANGGIDPEVLKFAKLALENPEAAYALIEKRAAERQNAAPADAIKQAEEEAARETEEAIFKGAAEHYLHGQEVAKQLIATAK